MFIIKTRTDLQTLLETLLGTKNVYYRTPENFQMSYPCIKYETDDIDKLKADNIGYRFTKLYNITIISQIEDEPVIEKILGLPMSSYDRHYVSDNLNHDTIQLYF